jgi:hypothetical protein
MTKPLSQHYNIADEAESPSQEQQAEMWPILQPKSSAIIDDLRAFAEKQLASIGLPPAIAKYLVKFDTVRFKSSIPSDFRFKFSNAIIPFDSIHVDVVGFDIGSLLESFSVHRLYAPREVADATREHLDDTYRK